MSDEIVKNEPVAHHGEAVPVRRRKGHCARFWWIYAVIFVLIAIIAFQSLRNATERQAVQRLGNGLKTRRVTPRSWLFV